jgi:two-component system response regulator
MEKLDSSILIVEDDAEDAFFAIRLLQKIGVNMNLIHMGDGNEALKFLLTKSRNDFPKLIIVDLNLNGLCGIELIRKIKAHDALKRIPIVVLTGSDSEKDIIETYKLSVNAHLFKPIDFMKASRILSFVGIKSNFIEK